MPDFGQRLAAAIEAKGLTRLAFARAAGCPVSLVSQAVRGTRKPPLARLETWSQLLLTGERERVEFVRLGALLHAPPAVQEWVTELQAVQAAAPTKRRR